MLNVVCVKSRPHYNHEYVNRLYAMVERNLTVPHRFVCLTDDPGGVKCQTRALPKIPQMRGWWAKIALFQPGRFSGKTLYLDLDTVICRNIDFLATYTGPFAILEDFYRLRGYGSGVMLWNAPQDQVWNDWAASGYPDDILGDQGWMEKKVKADYLQHIFGDRIVSFKAHCESGLPSAAAIVCFHGVPKPHDLPMSHWASRLWRGADLGKLIEEQREKADRARMKAQAA